MFIILLQKHRMCVLRILKITKPRSTKLLKKKQKNKLLTVNNLVKGLFDSEEHIVF